MAFEMQVVSHAPLTGESDARRVARLFFALIGYTAKRGPDHGVSFRMFYECFLLHPTKEWTVEELAQACETTLPSIYRHVNKLTDLDIVEDLHIEVDGDRKRAFRLRYGDLSKAWNFAEAHFDLAIQNYRKSVDHLEELLQEERQQVAGATATPSAPA
ncbi:MAG: helix-turn-helix domain-containing protein [Thermoplasmatota archaeon]